MIDSILSRLEAAPPDGGPKYRRLRDILLAAIEAGDWQAGSRLPTEIELSRALPYSLGTVQKAYAELVRDGLIVRNRGRGSFVAGSGHRRMAEPWHCRFLSDAGTVLPVYPRLIGHRPTAEPRFAALFGETGAAVVIDRMLSIGGEFEVLSRFYAPEPVARALLRLPPGDIASANFKLVLREEIGARIARVTQTVAQAPADAWRALRLPGEAYLMLEATAFSPDGEVIYFQELHIPKNRRRLLFESDLKV